MADLSIQLQLMKRILILLLALLPFVAKAQMTVDHDIKDVVWENVYESSITYDEMLEYILAYDILDDVVTHGNMIAGDLHPVHLDYEAAGYGRMKVPLYLSNGEFACRIVIRMKEGKYKVEAFNTRFIDPDSPFGAITPLYEGYGEFGFDIAIGLVLFELTKVTSITIPSNEW